VFLEDQRDCVEVELFPREEVKVRQHVHSRQAKAVAVSGGLPVAQWWVILCTETSHSQIHQEPHL
jgi:hypothetical protein